MMKFKSVSAIAVGAMLAAALAVVVSTTLAPTPVAAQQAPVSGITVSGQGAAASAPTLAELNVGVQTTGLTAKQALDDNGTAMVQLISALQGAGVAAADIQTLGVSVWPNVGAPDENGVQSISSYQANNSVLVRLREPSRVGEIIDVAFSNGANMMGGITFGLEDPSAAQREALTSALTDARAKAEVIAAGIGRELGEVVAVSEESYFAGPYQPSVKSDAAGGTPVQPGNVTTSATVRVTYALR